MALPAWAGRNCDTQLPLKTGVLERGMTLASRTLSALDASGAEVVLLARAGQDLTKYGLLYSHFGFAYRQTDAGGAPVWRVLHKLNLCGSSVSAIYRQGLGEFFLDDLWRYEAGWVVPTPEVQAQLIKVLRDEPRSVLMHHKPYSMVSYAWSQKYQQSNQWAIETLALALGATSSGGAAGRAQAQAWLQDKGYQPTPLKIGALTRLGGRMTAANIAFDDHPNAKRFSDRIETVTVDSVFDWMARAKLTTQPVGTLR
ncbi:MAG: DUF2145 domain-containing protein [Rhodoferax sp.]|nr:DUF2145 domain-containing protein [Rhodoferax sp.]